jgi:hypothetical protein
MKRFRPYHGQEPNRLRSSSGDKEVPGWRPHSRASTLLVPRWIVLGHEVQSRDQLLAFVALMSATAMPSFAQVLAFSISG